MVVDVFEVVVDGCIFFYEVVVGGFRSFHVLVTTVQKMTSQTNL